MKRAVLIPTVTQRSQPNGQEKNFFYTSIENRKKTFLIDDEKTETMKESSSPSTPSTSLKALTIGLTRTDEDEKRGLRLLSPVGATERFYSWPLKKGKGSMRRSEDKHDEAAEIVETIR